MKRKRLPIFSKEEKSILAKALKYYTDIDKSGARFDVRNEGDQAQYEGICGVLYELFIIYKQPGYCAILEKLQRSFLLIHGTKPRRFNYWWGPTAIKSRINFLKTILNT